MNDSQALARSISCLLDNTTPDSTWGDFQVEWNPIITTLTCKLLLSCGLSRETPWYIDRNRYISCTLADSFRWLNNAIRPDGSFGTDFWDSAQLGIVIEKYTLGNDITAYPSLKQHLVDSIQSRRFLSDASHWKGPGFLAAAIEYARAAGEVDQATTLTKELLLQIQSKGYWEGHRDPTGAPVVSPVWHTAQCVIVLATDSDPHIDVVKKAARWLRKTQDESGAWISVHQYKIYFTAYAVLALLHDRLHSNESLHKGIEYLKSQMAPDGKCSDLGGTLMCALALKAVVDDHFEKDLTLVDYVLAKKNLMRADAIKDELEAKSAELAHVQSELKRYEKKFGDADFAVTKKQLFLITLLGLFLTALGTVAGVYAIGPLFHGNSPAPAINPPRQTEQVAPKHDSASSLPPTSHTEPVLPSATGSSSKRAKQEHPGAPQREEQR